MPGRGDFGAGDSGKKRARALKVKAQIKLFRIWGIQIGLHYSWLLIALLVTLSLAGQFQATNPQWGANVVWVVAILTALLFFAAIVLHELSHAAIAKARGLPVKSITLFALGGVAQIEKEASDPKTEFWMGIVGPITSALIGGICLALAVFNMVPGFPLDGGRVLRAIVWWITGNGERATRIAATTGQGIAFVFIIVGLFRFFNGAGFGGLWLTFIGWFLLDAARSSYAQTEILKHLRGVRVRDVMTHNWPAIESGTNLQSFVDEYLLRSGHRNFAVQENGRLIGLITPHEVKDIDRARCRQMTVRVAVRPLA